MSARRPPLVGRFTAEEIALAGRNRGMPLEALRHDVTPGGLHYLLVHFDIPFVDASRWSLRIDGCIRTPLSFTLDELRALPSRTLRVTMECAGNGRGQLSPRYPSVPWLEEGVSTAEWTGVPLEVLLGRAGLRSEARDVVFRGADRGIDRGVEHDFARSLVPEAALNGDVLVAYEMNRAPLPPQHGAPLRLVVPRWYGMASVKWLQAIEVLDRPFDGLQQAVSYHFRRTPGERGDPCREIRVNSLMVPPGIPDFYSRERVAPAGVCEIFGRAWSGLGAIERVEFGMDGTWQVANLSAPDGDAAWQAWTASWTAAPGRHELSCRAFDTAGNAQPLDPPWDVAGFGNNSVQRVNITVVG